MVLSSYFLAPFGPPQCSQAGEGLEKSLDLGARRGQGLKPLLESQDQARPRSLALLADGSRQMCTVL